MNKIIVILIFILSFFIISNSYCNNFDFRTVTWGMSRVEVLASEKLKPLKATDDYISYKVNFFNDDIFLLYEFVLNNLYSARYVYENPRKEYVNKILNILNIKYGEKKIKNGLFFYENNLTIIEVESGEEYLKIFYKSKKIDKINQKNKEQLRENEKKYLLSIF